jgi:hypothetical protein
MLRERECALWERVNKKTFCGYVGTVCGHARVGWRANVIEGLFVRPTVTDRGLINTSHANHIQIQRIDLALHTSKFKLQHFTLDK